MSIFIVGFVVGLALLWKLIGGLRRLIKESVEAAVPVVPQQEIEFRTPGVKCLHIEGPPLSMALSGASFAMRDEGTGQEISIRRALFRSRVSGLSKVRLLLYRCAVSHGGRFDLAIAGLKKDVDYSTSRIVFTRPYMAKAALFIVGLVLSGGLTISSLVFGILALAGHS